MRQLKSLSIMTILCLFACLFTACKKDSTSKKAAKARTIYVYTYGDFPENIAQNAITELKKVYPPDKIIVKGKLDIPDGAEYMSEKVGYKRLWAPTLLKYQDSLYNDESIVVAFTAMDIASNVDHKGVVDKDWGIFGLGSSSWHSCVCSLYRMRKKSDRKASFSKLVQHELGHCFGLPHCTNSKTCIVSDAEKKYHLPKLNGFCPKCKEKLNSLGWEL